MTLTTTLNREDQDIPVTVEFTYMRGCRGARDSLCGKRGAGPPLEPDEPDEIEIATVQDDMGNEIECTDKELALIEEECWATVENE